ncbi:MAG: S8 family serine peptidase, partial [Solirubrobacterales bacterium]
LGDTWTAPATGGPFAFGTLVEDRLDLAGGELLGDLDRDGVKGETFGVIQNRDSNRVLVDTDQDLDFTDETPIIDLKVNGDVGTLGQDDPGTAIAESLSFTVQTDRSEYDPAKDEGSWVDIGIAGGSHGSHVAGITAANEMFGGAMGGAAPGAQVMSIQVCLASDGCLNSAMMDGMIYAAENGADVANMSVGGLPALNDGSGARAELYNRLIDKTGMQIFISAGNSGTGANTVGDPSTTSDVVSVGASISKETWLANYGATVEPDQMLMPFSSRGPSESGAMKPDLVAPGSAISTIQPWLPGSPVAGTFGLPPGYAMYNGTSMSSPLAAGDAALLVGAYKNEFGENPSPVALRNAMISTSDFIPGVGAYGQGTGLIDIDAAWTQLSQVAPVAPPKIKAEVPVNTVLSEFLNPAGIGSGIHEREGVKAGDELTRNYTLTRTTGDAGSQNFGISWKGNDGTFSTAASVALPLNTPVQIPVDIAPAANGIHSAVMQLDDPATNGIDLNTQNVVFATDPGAGWTIEKSGTVRRADGQGVLIDVPEGASALRVELRGGSNSPADGQIRFQRIDPYGLPVEDIGTRECFVPATTAGCSAGSPTARVVENPIPGVWEIAVEGGYRSSQQESPWNLKATILNASVSPEADYIRVGSRDPVDRTYEVTNDGAPFTGLLTGGTLSSTSIERPTISGTTELAYDLTVPEGATSVSASTGNPDPDADLDLYLQRCDPDCVDIDASERADSEEAVSEANPEPGDYRVVVVPYDLPGGPTAFDYSDSITSSGFGEITTDDEEAPRPSGATWPVGATITPGAADAGAGRTLQGELRVLDDSGAAIGSGTVLLDIDTTTPEVTIDQQPGASTDRTPTFAFSSSNEEATFECRIDEGPWAACTSPHTTEELTDGLQGDHELSVQATDGVGNTGSAAVDFTVVAETSLSAAAAPVAWWGASTRVSPSARLVKARDGDPLAGQTVSFVATGGTALCSAITDASGQAWCSVNLKSFNPAVTTGYTAAFAGERRLQGASANGTMKGRTGKGPDRKAPKFVGKVRLRPASPKAGRKARIRFRASEPATLTVKVGGRVVGKKVTLKTSQVLLPRLRRGRQVARLVLTDAAKNRSKVRKIRFRVR